MVLSQSDKFLSFTTKYEGELPQKTGTYLVSNPITAANVLPDILPLRLAPEIALLLAEGMGRWGIGGGQGELPRLAGTYLVCNPITAAYVLPDILPLRLAPAIALLLAEGDGGGGNVIWHIKPVLTWYVTLSPLRMYFQTYSH